MKSFQKFLEAKKSAKPAKAIYYDMHWITGENVPRPKIVEWIAGNATEWIQYYNHTGHVIHFTNDINKAQKTTDLYDAREWARIANEVYRRTGFSARPEHLVK